MEKFAPVSLQSWTFSLRIFPQRHSRKKRSAAKQRKTISSLCWNAKITSGSDLSKDSRHGRISVPSPNKAVHDVVDHRQKVQQRQPNRPRSDLVDTDHQGGVGK